ncbi:enoyl-CoA hydratase/isomerase family protein [Tessaracoccus sp. ZS01]|uniref:enoyl-CoA hydratase/isomerase family protein n=1 Tax=Tessaracoccus sp. ZS01 TaxID=1906324 RepID=UPI00096E1979|nr:enoyl-CoA hydratase-related protein [Tessaracoccus sp. ZS01]MCG6566848.1 enoyl-CoA hydratase [Tessaracoccus sp. ZS01]OMG57986.1 enoyl-CoA hydratase [Tessaracoccus sp. ZS01]
MTDPLLVSIDDGLAHLTLNRPERLNAFNADLARAWEKATVDITSRSDVGAILIDGAGPGFCAGGDVIDMATTMGSPSDLEELAHTINRGIRALTESSIPVVAAVHGVTAGGGLGVLLSSDYVVAAAGARIGSRYANIGLTPDLSVTAQLSRAVGTRRALQLVLSDRMLTAEEAQCWGLVAEVVRGEGYATRAHAVARSWLDGAASAYGEAKRLIRSSCSRSFADQLDEEARTIAASFGTDEARDRINAFLQAKTERATRGS